jgi:hypothetical protein
MLLGEPAHGGMLVYMSLIYIIGPFLDSFKFLGSMCYDAANIYIHKYIVHKFTQAVAFSASISLYFCSAEANYSFDSILYFGVLTDNIFPTVNFPWVLNLLITIFLLV